MTDDYVNMQLCNISPLLKSICKLHRDRLNGFYESLRFVNHTFWSPPDAAVVICHIDQVY